MRRSWPRAIDKSLNCREERCRLFDPWEVAAVFDRQEPCVSEAGGPLLGCVQRDRIPCSMYDEDGDLQVGETSPPIVLTQRSKHRIVHAAKVPQPVVRR